MEPGNGKEDRLFEKTGGRLERVFQRTQLRSAEGDAAGPSQQDELPDDFYEFTADDYARLMGNKKGEAVLRTRAMRDQDEREQQARFPSARIRVQFPDLYVVEASFPSNSSVDALFSFVSAVVRPGSDTWHLFTTPPKQRLSDRSRTLRQAGLVPLAQVFWALDKSDVTPAGIPESESVYLQKWVTDRRENELQAPSLQEEAGESEREAARKRAALEAAKTERSSDPGKSRARVTKPKWLKM